MINIFTNNFKKKTNIIFSSKKNNLNFIFFGKQTSLIPWLAWQNEIKCVIYIENYEILMYNIENDLSEDIIKIKI